MSRIACGSRSPRPASTASSTGRRAGIDDHAVALTRRRSPGRRRGGGCRSAPESAIARNPMGLDGSRLRNRLKMNPMTEHENGRHRLPERDRPWVMRTYAGHSDARALERALPRATSRRARPASRSPSTCRRRPATTPTPCSPAARSARSASRSSTAATWRRSLDQIPLGEMNTSMTINATAAWLLGLYVAVADEHGVDRGRPRRHDPERHHQGVPLARDLRLPARRPRCG